MAKEYHPSEEVNHKYTEYFDPLLNLEEKFQVQKQVTENINMRAKIGSLPKKAYNMVQAELKKLEGIHKKLEEKIPFFKKIVQDVQSQSLWIENATIDEVCEKIGGEINPLISAQKECKDSLKTKIPMGGF